MPVCIKFWCPSQCLPTSTKSPCACCISNFLIHVSCRSSLAQTASLAGIGFANSGPGFCAYFCCQDSAGERHPLSSLSVQLSYILHHLLGAVTALVCEVSHGTCASFDNGGLTISCNDCNLAMLLLQHNTQQAGMPVHAYSASNNNNNSENL